MTLIRVAAAFVLLAGAVLGAREASFPPELDQLNALVGDEAKLVDAVRQFDVLQQALIAWDAEIASEAARGGDTDEVQRREEAVRARVELLGKAYDALLAHYPRNARALNYYGEYLCDQKGEMAGAVSMWKKAIAEDPKLSLPHNNLGIYYTHVGEYSRGLASYNKALELEPDNADFKFNLAQVYLINRPQVKEEYKWDDARLYKEAMKLSKEAADLRPTDYDLAQDYAVNFFAATQMGVEADWNKAAIAWQNARARATQLDQVFYTWLNEARTRLFQGENQKAAVCLQEALKMDPNNAVAKQLLEKAKSAPKAG
ncbi:MAG: tetratricopeptide repeat protein [Candidatus Hydrogenedentes bacterium]|nr:tetratricopeptide repeat protein [Candidatus Hydrogenedentota bacterium]